MRKVAGNRRLVLIAVIVLILLIGVFSLFPLSKVHLNPSGCSVKEGSCEQCDENGNIGNKEDGAGCKISKLKSGSCCSGSCIDTSSDDSNCGSCGNVCPGSDVCNEGKGCRSGVCKVKKLSGPQKDTSCFGCTAPNYFKGCDGEGDWSTCSDYWKEKRCGSNKGILNCACVSCSSLGVGDCSAAAKCVSHVGTAGLGSLQGVFQCCGSRDNCYMPAGACPPQSGKNVDDASVHYNIGSYCASEPNGGDILCENCWVFANQ